MNTLADTEQRVERVAVWHSDPHGESRVVLHKLNIKGLFSWPTVIKGGIHGLDHKHRQFRCEELRATRAAKRLMRELGFGPTHTGCGRDCTAQWFCSDAELIHVDPIYCYAIVKTSHSLDV